MASARSSRSGSGGDLEVSVKHIRRLVGDLDILRTSWERAPFVSTGLGSFDDIFSLDSMAAILDAAPPLSSIRLFRDGAQVPPESTARLRDPNPRGPVTFADRDKVIEAVADGATLIVEEMQTHSPAVAAFASAVTHETGYHADCTAFATPARNRGANPHFDPTGAFLRQVYGEKRWVVREPIEPWPRRKWRGDDVFTGEVLLDVVLRAGDCLYIPRGFVHVGEATDQPSVHLSVGLGAPTWGRHLVDLVREQMVDHESMRECLPPLFADVDRAEVFEQRRREFVAIVDKLQWPGTELPTGADASAPRRTHRPGALRAALGTSTEATR
jgi:hypothetical protein